MLRLTLVSTNGCRSVPKQPFSVRPFEREWHYFKQGRRHLGLTRLEMLLPAALAALSLAYLAYRLVRVVNAW